MALRRIHQACFAGVSCTPMSTAAAPSSAPVFMFPGQGAQVAGMGRDLLQNYPYTAAIGQEADEAVGWGLTAAMTDPAGDLTDTRLAQPAMVLYAAMAVKVLEEEQGVFVEGAPFVMGHSVGEFSALMATGALTLHDALQVVSIRAQAMASAMEGQGATSMAAVMPVSAARAADAAAQVPAEVGCVAVANANAPTQTVLSGHKAAVEAAVNILRESGRVRSVSLPVSAPFHSPLMAPALPALAQALGGVAGADALPPHLAALPCVGGATTFSDLVKGVDWPATPLLLRCGTVPLLSGVTADLLSAPGDVAAVMTLQALAPVRWTDAVTAATQQHDGAFLEVGPGSTLTRLVAATRKATGVA